MKNKKETKIKKSKDLDMLLPKEYRPLSPWNYLGRCILYAIPVIGWIFLLAHAIKDKNRHGRSFARSYFCALFVFAIVGAIAFALFQMGFFSKAPNQATPDPSETCTHETTEWVVDAKATCSAEGSKHKECVSCKKNLETATIAKTAHTEEVVNGKAATCTEDGLTAGKKCSICQAVILEQQKIDALNHSEGDWIIDKNAEVGVDGSKHKECTRCHIPLKTEVIPALEETHVCAGVEWVVVTPATCKEKGVTSFICSCGKSLKTAELGLVGHTEETVLGTAATCTEEGRTDGKKCSVCQISTVSQIIIPPTGHFFEAGTCKNCGMSEPYGLWISDGLGNPVSNVFVKIMKGDEQVKMYPYMGEFLSMELETGTYQIVLDLSQLNGTYTFDESLCVLTPEKRSTSIRLLQTASEETSLFVGYPVELDYPAYFVKEGATNVTLTPNDYTFFIFAPEHAAIYTITYEGNANLAISYHGSSFFTQGRDMSPDTSCISKYENGLAISIYASEIGGDYVFAIKSTSETSCVLKIENAGDPGTRIEDEPWKPYLEDSAMVEKQLNTTVEGTYTAVDLTDLSLKAVYNEADGFYHLGTADGPIIFIDLTDSTYVASIQTICALQRMGEYLYDLNGNLVEKRSYNELFRQYGLFIETEEGDSPVNDPVRVPLTKKLVEAVQSFGTKNGWWDFDDDLNIFKLAFSTTPYNQEYAWLLYCGYYA